MSLCGHETKICYFSSFVTKSHFQNAFIQNVNSNLSQVTPTGHCFHASNSVTKRWRLIVTTEQTVFIYL